MHYTWLYKYICIIHGHINILQQNAYLWYDAMVLPFQDEPDEIPRSAQKRSIFGDEPEEHVQQRSTKVSRSGPVLVPSSLFGDEPARDR